MRHSPAAPQASSRKLRSILAPLSVWVTSGWNWIPNRDRSRSWAATTGTVDVEAVASKPGGSRSTRSPWDIHTFCSGSSPEKRSPLLASSVIWVRPYSRRPDAATRPPRT